MADLSAKRLSAALVLALLVAVTACAQILGADSYKVAGDDAGAPDAEAPDASDPMAAHCTRTTGSSDPSAVVFGALLPYTTAGAADSRGLLREQAIDLAIDDMNTRGGVQGKKPFRVIFCDTTGDSPTATLEAQYLMAHYALPAMITEGSGDTISISAYTIPAGVLIVAASATSPELTTMNKKQSASDPVGLVWRAAPSDALQGKTLAQLVSAAATATSKVAVIAVDDPYGQGLAAEFGADYTKSTVQNFYFVQNSNAASVMSQIVAMAPDIKVLIGYAPDVTGILNAVPSTLQAPAWYFADSAESDAVFAAVNGSKLWLDGALGTAPAGASGAAYQQFVDRYKSRYGTDPSTASYTAHNYDAAYLLGLGASWAVGAGGGLSGLHMAEGLSHLSSGTAESLEPTDYTAMRNALEAGSDIDISGASGPLDFDPATGEAPSPIQVWKYGVDGGISPVKVCQPSDICTP